MSRAKRRKEKASASAYLQQARLGVVMKGVLLPIRLGPLPFWQYRNRPCIQPWNPSISSLSFTPTLITDESSNRVRSSGVGSPADDTCATTVTELINWYLHSCNFAIPVLGRPLCIEAYDWWTYAFRMSIRIPLTACDMSAAVPT